MWVYKGCRRRREENRSAEAELIPTTQKIPDSYTRLSAADKNSLWKIVMENVKIYRSLNIEFSMHSYQKLPMKR